MKKKHKGRVPLKTKSKLKAKPNIILQKVLAETKRRSYELLRLSRVSYLDNPSTFIDLRLFQRGFDDHGNELFYPTKQGVQIKENDFQKLIGKWTIVPSLLFHPIIIKKAYPAFQREEFSSAVFNAFKAVEVSVRSLSRLSDELVGTALMRKAFDADSGILSDKKVPIPEREALSHLFAGAIGCYKNPHSHRDVELSFNEAFEMLLLASHLLQILDRFNKKLANKLPT